MKEKIHNTRCGDVHYFVSDSAVYEKPVLLMLPGLTADHRLFDKRIEYFGGKYNLFTRDTIPTPTVPKR